MTTTRRSNGEGHPRKRADGRWEMQATIGGTRRSLYGKTRAEVLRKRKEAEVGVVKAVGTFSELADAYLAHGMGNRAPLTKEAYERRLRVHILPEFGGTKLSDLSAPRVERWLVGLQDLGLKPNTVSGVGAVLRIVLAYGVRTERVARNAAALVPVPSGTRKRVEPLAPDELRALLAALRADRFGPIYLLILGLGLRRSEALGLTWRDVDLANGHISVRRQLLYIRREGFALADLKTDKSRRDLHLPAPLVELLKEQAGVSYPNNPKYDSWQLVFRTPEGRPNNHGVIFQHLKRALARAGLPTTTSLHDLRHHHASILFAQGVDTKMIQEQLGHANIGVTMDVYTHLLPHARRDATERVWDYLEGE